MKVFNAIYTPANLSKYSIVNHIIQMASIMASLGLSAGFPSASMMATEGMVLAVMPAVDSTTKVIEMMLTHCK